MQNINIPTVIPGIRAGVRPEMTVQSFRTG
jgi:hypothetical protein